MNDKIKEQIDCLPFEVIEINNYIFYRWCNPSCSNQEPVLKTEKKGIDVHIKSYDSKRIVKKKTAKAFNKIKGKRYE